MSTKDLEQATCPRDIAEAFLSIITHDDHKRLYTEDDYRKIASVVVRVHTRIKKEQNGFTYFKNLIFQDKGNTYQGGYVRPAVNTDGYHGQSENHPEITSFFFEASYKRLVAGEKVTMNIS